jgi:hypothetical protein
MMEKATQSNHRVALPSDLSAAGTIEDREIPEPRAGALCPKCGQANLDYDGLLNLTCPNCGYTAAGCFT